MAKVSKIRWQVAQFLEFRWWLNYLKGKAAETYQGQKKAYWKMLLSRNGALPVAGQSALDAGCGPSGIYMVLPGLEVDAVDPLIDKYATGLEVFKVEDYPWTTFYSAPLEQWSAPRSYDWIFCMNAINHFRHPEAVLMKLRDAMAQDARLLLGVDAHTMGCLKYFFRALPGDILHPHQMDAADYRQMLRDAGFDILQEQVCKKGRIFDYIVFMATIPSQD